MKGLQDHFQAPQHKTKKSLVGLYIGAPVSFQDPKQAYEMKGCGLGSACASVRVFARYDVAFLNLILSRSFFFLNMGYT